MMRVRKRRWNKAKKSKKADHITEYEEIQDQIVKEMEIEYNNYLEKLFDPADSRNKRNLFSFIKSKGRDQIGTPPLQHNNRLMTSAEDRAEALSYQYESVFTEEDTINISDKGHSPYPAMEQIVITVPGVVKLLQSINPKKAIGPDCFNIILN